MKKYITFTGHRSNKIYGYSITKNPKYQHLAKALKIKLKELIEEGHYDFLTGSALGFDTIAFFTIECLKKEYKDKGICLNNVLAIPFKKQGTKWFGEDKERYNRMLSLADEIIYVDEINKYDDTSVNLGEFSKKKMMNRNKYMIDHSFLLFALFDGSPSGTKNCIEYAKNKSHIKNIIYINKDTLEFKKE